MDTDYTRDEVKQLIEHKRDGESLTDIEWRLVSEFVQRCKRDGRDPLAELERYLESNRD